MGGLLLLQNALGSKPSQRSGAAAGEIGVPVATLDLPSYTEIRLEHLIDPATGQLAAIYLPEESILESTIVDPRYRVFGDAAVVTYIRLQQRGRATTRTEETRVWRRCAPGADAALGRWRLVHFHRSEPRNAYG